LKAAVLTISSTEAGGYEVAFARDDDQDNWPDRTLACEPMPSPTNPDEIRQCLLEAEEITEALNKKGLELAGLLLRGDVKTAFEEATTRPPGAAADCEGTRILLDVQPPELRMLPWELARVGVRAFFADVSNPWSRIQRFAPATPRPGECWPMLRVLIVVGAAPDEEEQLHAQQEARDVQEALIRLSGLVDLDVLDRPTRTELKSAHDAQRPHVLHFIGHGGDGVLDFAEKDGQAAWEWGPEDIAADLQAHTPQLVVLNACRTADLSAQEGSWEITDAFTALGVPATVTMQGDIDGRASTAFARELYEELARDAPLDVAVAKARNAISIARGWKRRDVFLPCLTLSVPPDRVLPKRYGVSSQVCDQIINRPSFKKVYAFSDRKQYRRDLWRRLGEGSPHNGGRGAVAVTGGAKVGKSELVKWCLGSLALRGSNVAYVDLDRSKLDSLETLGRIAEELAQSPTHGEQNAAAFDEWLARVDASQAGPPPDVQLGSGKYSRKLQPGSEEVAPDIFGAFLAALETAAGSDDLVIALDNVESVENAHWSTYVRPRLVRPIAEGHLPVRLVLVGEKDRLEALLGAPLWERLEGPIRVAPISEDYKDVMGQYLRARGFEREQFEGVVAALAEDVPTEWSAELFEMVETIATALPGWDPTPWPYT
jgi:hypothetical protein